MRDAPVTLDLEAARADKGYDRARAGVLQQLEFRTLVRRLLGRKNQRIRESTDRRISARYSAKLRAANDIDPRRLSRRGG